MSDFEALNANLLHARQEARAEWSAFDAERQRMIKAHVDIVNDRQAMQRLEALHARYEAAAGRVQTLEAEFTQAAIEQAQGPGSPSLDPSTPAAPAAAGGAMLHDPGAGWMKWGREVATRFQAAVDGTVGGAASPPFFDSDIKALPARRLFVRSVIPTVAVDSNTVDFVQQTVRTNAAAAVAAGGTKPTSTYTIARKNTAITTIAHVTEAIDRALLMDFGILSTFLANELRLGVLLAEEDQILNGNGTPPNLRGILNTSGIGTTAVGTGSRSEALYHAMTILRLAFFEPDAVVMHPTDFEAVRLEKDANGDYTFGPPTDDDPRATWSKTIIQSPLIAQGTALVGSFAQGAVIYDREQARVDVSESHASLFVTNQVIVRGESRIGVAVPRPAAFVTVTGL